MVMPVVPVCLGCGVKCGEFHASGCKKVGAVEAPTQVLEEHTDWPAHIAHCCAEHGCKYGPRLDCPVCMKQRATTAFCEECDAKGRSITPRIIKDLDDNDIHFTIGEGYVSAGMTFEVPTDGKTIKILRNIEVSPKKAREIAAKFAKYADIAESIAPGTQPG